MASKKKDLLNKILEENKSKDNYYSNNEKNSITNKYDILKARDQQKKDSDFNELVGRDSGDKIPGVDSIIDEETAANIDVFLDSSNDELVSMVGDEIESTNQNIIKDVNIDDILGFTNNKSDEIVKEIETKDKEKEEKEKEEVKPKKRNSQKTSNKDTKEDEIEFNLNNIDFSDLNDSDFPSYSKENENFDFNEMVEDATNSENVEIHSTAESIIDKNNNSVSSTDTEEDEKFDEEFIKSIEDNNEESRKNIKEEKANNTANTNNKTIAKKINNKDAKKIDSNSNTKDTSKNQNNSNESRNINMKAQNKNLTNTTIDKNSDFYSRYISNFDSMLKDLANRFIDENIQNETIIGNFDVSNSAVVLMYIKDKINQ